MSRDVTATILAILQLNLSGLCGEPAFRQQRAALFRTNLRARPRFKETGNVALLCQQQESAHVSALNRTKPQLHQDASLAEFPDAVEALFLQRELTTNGRYQVLLLEKAFAKMLGSYTALSGGNCCSAFRAFTGENSYVWARSEGETARVDGEWKKMQLAEGEEYFQYQPGLEERRDAENLWEEVRGYDRQSFLIACSMRAKHGQDHLREDGLVEAHAYSLLHAVDVEGQRLVFLRNPWGNDKRWNGRWCDGDEAWDRFPSLRKRLRPKFRSDGAFWMAWVDFQASFDFVFVCPKTMRSAAAASEHRRRSEMGEAGSETLRNVVRPAEGVSSSCERSPRSPRSQEGSSGKVSRLPHNMDGLADLQVTPLNSLMGRTPTYLAARAAGADKEAKWRSNGHICCLEVLLEMGAIDLDKPDDQGLSPLLASCSAWSLAGVVWLLRHGADCYAEDRLKHNALYIACANGPNSGQIVRFLCRWDADVSRLKAMRDWKGRRPQEVYLYSQGWSRRNLPGGDERLENFATIWEAARDGDVHMLRLSLKDARADSAGGWTPLMYAAKNGHVEIVRMRMDRIVVKRRLVC
eukprot:s1939_g8.t2